MLGIPAVDYCFLEVRTCIRVDNSCIGNITKGCGSSSSLVVVVVVVVVVE